MTTLARHSKFKTRCDVSVAKQGVTGPAHCMGVRERPTANGAILFYAVLLTACCALQSCLIHRLLHAC